MRYITKSIPDLKDLLEKKGLIPEEGSRAINIETGTTWEFGKLGRQDTRTLNLPEGKPGEPGKNGEDGRDGRDGKDGRDGIDGVSPDPIEPDLEKLSDIIIEKLLKNDEFLEKTEGRRGEPGKNGENGKDGKDAKDGINGKDGIDGKDGKDGKDGRDAEIDIDVIIQKLKEDIEFLSKIKGKDGKDGKDGIDGRDGIDAPRNRFIK